MEDKWKINLFILKKKYVTENFSFELIIDGFINLTVKRKNY